MASQDIAQQIIEQASTIIIFGHAVNVWAIMLLGLFGALLYALDKARRTGAIDWADLVTSVDQGTGLVKASLPKILQLIGGITATFIVIKLTLQNAINWDIFGIYLTYVAGVESFSRFMLAKYGVTTGLPVIQPQTPPPIVTTTTTTSIPGPQSPPPPGPAPKPKDDDQ